MSPDEKKEETEKVKPEIVKPEIIGQEIKQEPEKEPSIEEIKAENEKLKAEKKKLLDEHSNLGRRVKNIEEDIGNKVNTLIQKFDSININKESESEPEPEEEFVDITDTKQLASFIEKKAEKKLREAEARKEKELKQQQEYKSKYEKEFLNELDEFYINDGEDVYTVVLEEIKNNNDKFNLKYSDNGKIDAQLNYAKAKASVLAKSLQGQGKENPFTKRKKTQTPGLGVGDTGSVKPKEEPLPKLSPDAENYLRSIGKLGDTEFIKRVLTAKQ